MSPVVPTLSFLIPSLHDGVQLECRVYHPLASDDDHREQSQTVAVVAHPYAPLGGCYDVPVVLDVVKALLKEHVTVGTLNFRGAGGSKGRTSWTGKGEATDYESFIIFLLFYIVYLRNNTREATLKHSVEPTVMEVSDSLDHKEEDFSAISTLKLVLAGYSYGSLVVTHLPSIEEVLSNNICLPLARYFHEIIATAQTLATQAAEGLRKSGHRNSHIRIGSGDESAHDSRHVSHHTIDVLKHLPHSNRRNSSDKSPGNGTPISQLPRLPRIESNYLLISPILPPLSYGVMLPLGRRNDAEAAWQHHPTFAIFGDRDGFSSIKKLSPWAQALAAQEHTTFEYAAVAGAGHFWIEEGVAEKMKGAIREWIRSAR